MTFVQKLMRYRLNGVIAKSFGKKSKLQSELTALSLKSFEVSKAHVRHIEDV